MAEPAVAQETEPQITDEERDSLHILPLAMIDLETPVVRRFRLVKNANLDTMIEIFDSRHTGSGQVDLAGLAREMGWSISPLHPDLKLLRQLVMLPSFDVYSLRILFRDNNIPIKSQSALSLSPAKVKQLNAYMTKFTRPLMREIYQGEDAKVESFDDILRLFRDPDVKKVRERLQQFSEALGITIEEIPKFLEDYADTFLSLSYYRACLDQIMPTIDDFLTSLRELKKNHQLASDRQFMNTCDFMETTINELLSTTSGWLENFERNTDAIWENMSADTFRNVEAMIKSYHTVIGGILCALSVKMNAWAKLFPKRNVGGPLRRAEFVMTDMRLGLNRIQKIESSNPMPASVASAADHAEQSAAATA